MNQILYSKKNAKKRVKKATITVCFFIILLVVFSTGFGIANKGNKKILKGVFLNNENVGGLTVEEATARMNEKLNNINNSKITLSLGDYSKTITGKDLGVTYPENIAEEAYNYGRTGNLISDNYTVLASKFGKKNYINVDFKVDDNKCQTIIQEISDKLGLRAVDDKYTVDEEKISLAKGSQGRAINRIELEKQLNQSLGMQDVAIDIPVEIADPQRVNFDALYKEVYVEKVEASFDDKDGFQVTKDVTGVYFDKEAAMNQYASLKDGETMDIKLLFVEPTVRVSDLNNILFKDVLATFQTKYDKYNTNRSNNLEIAARNINGTILYPDDEFSYNGVVGERTVKNGFKEVHVFEGGRVVDGLGGGICQVSSTLYNSVLLSNLQVTQRAAHMMHTGYVDPGRDATVVYGSVDFKFKNNRKTPVKIETTVKNGICTATIYGMKEENEPKVEIKTVILQVIPYTIITEDDPTMEEGKTQVVQSPLNGYVSETYKILKDADGKEISNTLISKDSYKQTSKIIKVGTKVVAPEVVEPDPTVAPTSNPNLPTGWDNPESPYAQ